MHEETQGGIIVKEGNENPSNMNMEGQNAQHTSAAGEALSGATSSRSGEVDEKEKEKGGGKVVMEKYAYHSMLLSFFFFVTTLSLPTIHRREG